MLGTSQLMKLYFNEQPYKPSQEVDHCSSYNSKLSSHKECSSSPSSTALLCVLLLLSLLTNGVALSEPRIETLHD